MSQQQIRAWAVLAVAVLSGAAAMGQDAPPPQPEATEKSKVGSPEPRPVQFSFSVRGDLAFNTDLDGAPGDVTVTRVGGEFGAVIPVADRGRLSLGFDYEHSNYDFHDATGFTPGSSEPFREINRETLSGSFYRQESQQWGWLVGGSFSVSAEDGAKIGDSLEGSGYAGVRYAINDHLSIGGGIIVSTRIEDNPDVWPLLSLDWQISDQWRLSSEGRPGLTLSYAPSERWTVFLAGEYQYRDFRLDRNGPVPNGVGRDRRFPVMVGARFAATKGLNLEGGFGAYFGQNYEVDNSGGNKLADADANAAPFIQLKLTYRF